MSESIYQRLLQVRDRRGAGFVVLVDPDKLEPERIDRFGGLCQNASVDAIFVGGSLCTRGVDLDSYVAALIEHSGLPVVGFPGSINQLSRNFSAVLFLSIISSRNAEYLFGQHVHAAPVIRQMEIEPISTGYMLVESGHTTTAQYISNSLPIPRRKPDVAAATGLAAEMMGMKLLFADGGSGADDAVPEEMVAAITETCSVPLVVGGGLRSPQDVARRVQAGAGFVVVGNAFEDRPDATYMAEMTAAAHSLVPRPL